jgi:hypothetical protein
MRPLFYTLWFLPKALQLLLLLAMWRRGLLRRFEVFAAYNLFTILKSAALSLIISQGLLAMYWWSSWSLEFIEAIVVLAVVFESLAVLIKPFQSIQGTIKTAFRWILPICLLGACIGLTLKPGSLESRMLARVVALDWILVAMELSAILVTFVLCKSFGVGMRRFAAIILSGLALYCAVDLFGTNNVYHRLGLNNAQFNWINMTANALMVSYWVVAFCLVRESAAPPGGMKRERDQLQRWATDINDIARVR